VQPGKNYRYSGRTSVRYQVANLALLRLATVAMTVLRQSASFDRHAHQYVSTFGLFQYCNGNLIFTETAMSSVPRLNTFPKNTLRNIELINSWII
jgi:hypothetical protein